MTKGYRYAILDIVKKLLLLIITAICICQFATAQKEAVYYEKIVGTWIGRDNTDIKWVFNPDSSVQHYIGNKLLASYFKYEIVRTSEECGHNYYVEDIYILKMSENTAKSLTDYKIETAGDTYYNCAYIDGIEDSLLSLSGIRNGGHPLILNRQTIPVIKGSYSQEDKYFKSIVGTWTDPDQPNVKWMFDESNNCKWYKDGNILATFTYVLSDVSPECNITVSSPTYKALRLIDSKGSDSIENYCYYVNGITEYLSLTSESGGVYLLERQEVSSSENSMSELNSCTQEYDDWAFVCIRGVMYSQTGSETREEASLQGIDLSSNSLESLAHVSDNQKCAQIQNYIQSVPFIKNIDDNTAFTKYFYVTDQFYFVFWGPEPGRIRLTSVNGVVIAIKKDFSKHWVF